MSADAQGETPMLPLLSIAAALHAAAAAACPEGFTCYTDGPAFAKALGDSSGGPSAPASAKLALLCPAAAPCRISNTQLGFVDGVAATALMEHVVVDSNDAMGGNGGLLNIGAGNVTGSNVHFQGGTDANYGGCVYNHEGVFHCTDCVFERCACQADDDGQGGGVFSDNAAKSLSLVRTQFKNCSCIDTGAQHGAGCWCAGESESVCGGCTCKGGPGSFYCENGPSSPPPPPPPPPGPPVSCANFSGDWHDGDRYRARINQSGCALTVTAHEPWPEGCGTPPLPPCRVDWVSLAPGRAVGEKATVFFCNWEGCNTLWPHHVPPHSWPEINATLVNTSDGQRLLWPRTCGSTGCVTVGNWTRGLGPQPAPAVRPKPPKGDWPGACCAASAFGCGVAPQRCGSAECVPAPWVNCTDGKPKYCQDCGFPPCPNSTHC